MNEQFDVPNYITIVRLEETTDAGYCYIAYHPELPNAMSQGDTPEEATADLVEATELTLAHLISNGLPVPRPLYLESTSRNFYGMGEPLSNFTPTISSGVKNFSNPKTITAPSITQVF